MTTGWGHCPCRGTGSGGHSLSRTFVPSSSPSAITFQKEHLSVLADATGAAVVSGTATFTGPAATLSSARAAPSVAAITGEAASAKPNAERRRFIPAFHKFIAVPPHFGASLWRC